MTTTTPPIIERVRHAVAERRVYRSESDWVGITLSDALALCDRVEELERALDDYFGSWSIRDGKLEGTTA